MFQVIKKKGNRVAAYRLGDSHPVLSGLMDEGKIVLLENGDYEIFSEEVLAGGSGRGEIAHSGDYVKLSLAGFPYPNTREYFLENHRLISGDEYEQIPKLLYAWDIAEPMCEEVEFLMREKGLEIRKEDPEKYFCACLWGTVEAAPRDAVIVFYSITRDDAGQIADAEFNFIVRRDFEQFYDKIETVRLGIIGIGGMGSGHCRRIVDGEVSGVSLTAVADIRECRRQWAGENLPESVHIYETAEALMDSGDVDAILIATPHYVHPEIAIAGFQRNLHVLSEKPAGVYTRQVREMNEEAGRHDVVFAMMFNQRTNPLYRKMRELIQSGEYGALKRVNWIITDWYRTQAYYDSGDWRATWDGEGGGVLLNQCPHQLDLLQWLCGMPSGVQAFCHEGKWHDIEVEDDVTAYLEFPNGATGVFVTSTGDAPGTNRLEVDLERAKLVCENGKLTMYELKVNEREHCFSCKEGFAQPEGEWILVETPGENTQHNGVLQAFVDAIRGEGELIAQGSEGINGLMLSNAMHLSGWLGRPVKLPVDEELFLEELNRRRRTSRKKQGVTNVTFSTEGTYGS